MQGVQPKEPRQAGPRGMQGSGSGLEANRNVVDLSDVRQSENPG